MNIIKITGDNYAGHWDHTRMACRAVIIKEGKILLSYETVTDQWMIPGGGIEGSESEKECCIREIAEETGIVADVSECLLEIDEYYENWKWVNRYFIGRCTGETERHLTKREKAVGMEPRWISPEEIKDIFSKYRDYADTDEMRSGMYLREYTALCELEGCYSYNMHID